jgi:peptidoglycan/xylan/chitin deacetylase (PgdA/CDA1 family)
MTSKFAMKSVLTRTNRRLHKELAKRYDRQLATGSIQGPVVSFTFDDFPRSALTVAGNILEASGCRGTYYVSMGLMGSTTVVGQLFHRSDLDRLLGNGHELGCHTLDHASCLQLARHEYVAQCARNRQLAAELLGTALRNFSFPYGDVDFRVKRELGASYDTCRSIESGINRDPVDCGYLRANALYSAVPLRAIEKMVEDTVQYQSWLVLYTHDVCDQPSAYGCTPGYFEHVLRYVLRSGARVLPIRDVLSRCGVPRAMPPAARAS